MAVATARSKRERVQAAVRGEDVDRPPFCFWHHFRPFGLARALAEATVDFFGRYDLDIYKIMPDLPYPFPRQSIKDLKDWHLLAPLSVEVGNFSRVVATVRGVRQAAGPDIPIVVTVFSPITEVLHFAGLDLLRRHMQEDPATIHGALDVVSDNLARLSVAVLKAGADGIYVGAQGIGDGIFSESEYAEFGRPYDLRLLNACREGWLNIFHVHGEHDVRVEDVLTYPVAVVSWSDRITGIPLQRIWEAAPQLAVMGGLNERGAIVEGPAEALKAEMHDAISQTGGRRLILAPGCSVPDDCPDQWLHTARDAVDILS